jgi:hypothetical protein
MVTSERVNNQLDKSLIGMEPIQEILETAFFTSALAQCVPLSIILVGPPGTGKSKIILQYDSVNVHKTNDVTSQGLAELVQDDKEGKIRHIIIPDFNIVVSHKSATSNLTVASLLTLMSEGILRVDDGRRVKEIIHSPVGVITAMTRDIYDEHATRFRKLGIGRRFTPIFFGYSISTRERVQTSIKNGTTTLKQLQPRTIVLPPQSKWPIHVSIDDKLSDRIVLLSRDMSEALAFQPQWQKSYDGKGSNESWKIVPVRGATPIEFTPHMVLRAMAQAHALRANKRVVRDEDIGFLIKFITFANYSLPVML